MSSSSVFVTTTLVLFLIIVVGSIALQFFLSRRESRVPGLVLPALTLLGALVSSLVTAAGMIGVTWLEALVGGSRPLPGGQHPHHRAAGHLLRLPGEVPPEEDDGQDAHSGFGVRNRPHNGKGPEPQAAALAQCVSWDGITAPSQR